MLYLVLLAIIATDSPVGSEGSNSSTGIPIGDDLRRSPSEETNAIGSNSTQAISTLPTSTTNQQESISLYNQGLALLNKGENDAAIEILYQAMDEEESIQAAYLVFDKILSSLKVENQERAYEIALDVGTFLAKDYQCHVYQNNMGYLYESGRVPTSERNKGKEYLLDKAKEWYKESAAHGVNLAKENLERLEQTA